MLARVSEERGQLGGLRGVVIGGELGYGEPSCLIILEEINEDSKVLFHYGIGSFGLAVSLGVEGRRIVGLDSQAGTQFVPEMIVKLYTSVGNKVRG